MIIREARLSGLVASFKRLVQSQSIKVLVQPEFSIVSRVQQCERLSISFEKYLHEMEPMKFFTVRLFLRVRICDRGHQNFNITGSAKLHKGVQC